MRKSADKTMVTAEQLRKKLFLYLAAALLTLMVGIAITISFTLIASLKKAEAHNLSHMAELRSIAISEWCRHVKNIAQQITSRTRIRQELEKYNKGEITLQQLDRFTKPKLTDAMELATEVIGIVRLDINDQIVAHCGYGSRLTAEGHMTVGNISESVTLSKPLVVQHLPSIIVSAPILNRAGERQGTDLVIVGLALLKKVTNNAKELGNTSAIFIGYEVDHQIFPLFPGNGQAKDSQIKSDSFQAVQGQIEKAIYGESGFDHLLGLAVAYHPVKEGNWGLVITQNEQELYASLYHKIVYICSFAFLVYSFVLFGFWFIMKPMAGRIFLHTDELETKIRSKTETLEKEIIERKKAEKEKEEIIVELRDAVQRIKTLNGLLPICSSCKKIRDDKGYWSQIEYYISRHSDASFSHSICPDCARNLYPDLYQDKNT